MAEIIEKLLVVALGVGVTVYVGWVLYRSEESALRGFLAVCLLVVTSMAIVLMGRGYGWWLS